MTTKNSNQQKQLLNIYFFKEPSCMSETLSRSEQSTSNLWDLTSLYASEAVFDEELETLIKNFDKLIKKITCYQGSLQKDPGNIKQVLDLFFELDRQISKLYTYCHLKHDEDLSEQKWNSSFQRVSFLYQNFFQSTSWIEPELLSIEQNEFQTFIQRKELELYQFYFQTLRHKKEFTLTSDKEELMALAQLPLNSTQKAFHLFNNVDLPLKPVKDSAGKEHPLSHGNYRLYLRSEDAVLRKNAFLTLHESFSKFENTLSELLIGHVHQHIFDMRARGYSSCLMSALYPKNIPTKTYHNLIQTVKANAPLLHEYVRLRKEIQGAKAIHIYDLQVPFANHSFDNIPYSQAVEWIVESVAPLGEEYQQALQKGLCEQGWVDVYENKHKRSGAYSSGCYDSLPYILMNYKGTLNDVFTLAHEAGHSMHTLYSQKSQPYLYARYPIFVAEVASVFNETLLMDYLLKKLDREEDQWALLHERLEEIRNTLFRQTLFAEFELFLHESLQSNTPLTSQSINEKYLQLNKEYYGPNLTYDELLSIEWARVPHFYSNFYVYQYATGISAALTLAYRVLENEKGAKEAYLNFLCQGGHQYPIDLLKTAGVDMESSAPIEKALSIFSTLIKRLHQVKKNPLT